MKVLTYTTYTIIALALLCLALIFIPVPSYADEFDGQPTWQERNEQYIQEDQTRAIQRSVELQEQQMHTNSLNREEDYQRQLQQRQDPTDYRSLGQY